MKKLTKILLPILSIGLFGALTLGALYGSTYMMRDGDSANEYLLKEECAKKESDALLSRFTTSDEEFNNGVFTNLKNEFANLQFNQVAREARNITVLNGDTPVFTDATVIETSVSTDPSYNVMRCYSSTSWTSINTDNTVMIGRTISQKLYELTRNTYDVGNQIRLKYGEEIINLTIVGIYEDNLTSGEHNKWRTIGNYFEKAFNECFFVSNTTFAKKFKTNSAIALFSSSSSCNGARLSLLNKYVKKYHWNFTMDLVDSDNNINLNQKVEAINAYFDSKKRNVLIYGISAALVIFGILDLVLLHKSFSHIPVERFGMRFTDPTKIRTRFMQWLRKLFVIICILFPAICSLSGIFVLRRKIRVLQTYVKVPLCNNISISIAFILTVLACLAIFISKRKAVMKYIVDKDNISFGDASSKRDLTVPVEYDESGNKKKLAVFITLNTGNKNNANTLRDIQIGNMFKKQGYQIIYVNFGTTKYKTFVQEDYGTVVSLKKYPHPTVIGKVLNHVDLSTTVSEFVTYNIKNADAILVSPCINEKAVNYLYKHFKKQNTKFYLAMTERYSQEEFAKMTIMNKINIRNNHYFADEFANKDFKVICISKYLEGLYKEREMEAIRIPFVFDKGFYPDQPKSEHYTLNFMYSGIPLKKDALALSLEGFGLLSDEQLQCLRIHLVGVNEDWVKANVSEETFMKITNSLICYGIQSHDFVIEKFKEMDFTFLMRDPELIFTKAGFPTKVSESLHNKTPVVCNITSDLGDYLDDGVNSLIVKDYTAETFKNAIQSALKLNKNRLINMSEQAYKTAQEKLSLEAFENEFVDFVTKE